MTVTENNVTKVYSDKNEHIATITPHLNMWLLEAVDLPRIIAFGSLENAIYNAQ